MKIFLQVVLTLLVLLTLLSGISKAMLMEQEVEFFTNYGFTSSLLMAYGVFQIVGALLLAVPRTRMIGALFVAVSFVISAVVLLLAEKWAVGTATIIAMLLLVLVGRPPASGSQQQRAPN